MFCRHILPVQNRPVFDGLGGVVTDASPLQIGSTFLHWADIPRGFGWVRAGLRLVHDRARIQALDAPPNRTNLEANQTQTLKQFSFILEALWSVAHAYNSYNLCWYNDPLARSLYRKWISGPPQYFGQNAGQSLFLERDDYNSTWYTTDNQFPLVGPLVQNGSVLRNYVLEITKNMQFTGVRFAIPAMLWVAPVGTLRPDQRPESADRVYNAPMIRTKFLKFCPASPGTPWTRQCGGPAGLTNLEIPAQEIQRGGVLRAIIPGTPNLNPGFDDWSSTYFGMPYGSSETVCAPPLRWILSWLQEWLDALDRRTPEEVIQDSRTFVAYQNARTIATNGGENGAIAKIAARESDLESQRHASSKGAADAASGIATVGAAVAPVPIVGQILGAVLGVTAAAIRIGDALSLHGTMGHGRDDLGRYKIQWERAFLSGDPRTTNALDGAPALPESESVDPPGKTKVWDDDPCGGLTPTGAGTDAPPSSSGSVSSASVVPWVIGGAALLGAGIVLMNQSKR